MTTQTQQTKAAALRVPDGLTLPEKVVESIRISDTALQKAAAAEKAARTKQAEVNALIPKVVDTMIQHERITPQQREKLAEMLRDPAKTLELMMKVAGHRNADEIAKLGSGVTGDGQVKTASAQGQGYDPASSLTDPRVGVRTTRVKQSSVSLFQGLGLSAPSEG